MNSDVDLSSVAGLAASGSLWKLKDFLDYW